MQSLSSKEASSPLEPYLAKSSSSACAEEKMEEYGKCGINGLVRKSAEKPIVVHKVATFFSRMDLSTR